MIEAAERAAREAASLAFAAQWVGERGNAFNGERYALTGRAENLAPHLAFGRDGSVADAARQAAQAPWRQARAALLRDAEAQLPVL